MEPKATNLAKRRILATAAIVVWLGVVLVAFGPVRWTLGHLYGHRVEAAGEALPALTRSLALPVVGDGPVTAAGLAVRVLFWCLSLLGPLALLIGVWRSREPREIVEWLVYGGGIYGAVLALLLLLVGVGLVLPFVPII